MSRPGSIRFDARASAVALALALGVGVGGPALAQPPGLAPLVTPAPPPATTSTAAPTAAPAPAPVVLPGNLAAPGAMPPQGVILVPPGNVTPPGAIAIPPVQPGASAPTPAPSVPAPATAVVAPTFPALAADVQLVQFQAPEGVTVEVLGPPPEALPPAPAGAVTPSAPVFGLRVGVGYRLRLANLPERPGVALYPVVEIVGHLHRPPDVDPYRFPIRVIFREGDIEDAVDRGRLVTEVVYLEDPDQALVISLPKDEIPVATLSPAEDPLKVGSALGRAMAIVRLGSRIPNPEEWSMTSGEGLASAACPFSAPGGGRCPLPCGPARGTPPPPGRPWLPRDEFLCDGGDRLEPASFGGDGSLRGIDPRDAVIKFQADFRPRVLPTNMVCIYAPRFASVRTSVGPNQAYTVEIPRGAEIVETQVTEQVRQGPDRFVQNQSPQAHNHRARPSALITRAMPFQFIEVRVLQGFHQVTHVAGHVLVQPPAVAVNRQKAALMKRTTGPLTIKTAESAVVTGIVQGPTQTVMAWKPEEMAGVEVPPARPGMAVIKRVSAGVAEPGDVVTFAIQFRNMGNVPIGSVSILDSLMPRLEYLKGTAQGPPGTVFTAADNRVGSTELRWDLPGFIAPGAEGRVTFQARVR